ncbi:MAG TPA: hypothetical protein VH914_01210 [Acidimicrobiia bacterium]|nr:hypothetical protein [Acidimicrobiia bacterium]
MHGKKGQGRFRAFALGNEAEWTTVADAFGGGLERTAVFGSLDASEFTVSDPEALATGRSGTTVSVTGARETTGPLLRDSASNWLVVRFAAYLARYTNVVVSYDGTHLDPASILEHEEDVELDPTLGGDLGSVRLHVMEWKPEIIDHRSSIIVCDGEGVAIDEIIDRVPQTRKITAYLAWPGFEQHGKDISIAEMGHAVLNPIMDATRAGIADYLSRRSAAERQDVNGSHRRAECQPSRGGRQGAAGNRGCERLDD